MLIQVKRTASSFILTQVVSVRHELQCFFLKMYSVRRRLERCGSSKVLTVGFSPKALVRAYLGGANH